MIEEDLEDDDITEDTSLDDEDRGDNFESDEEVEESEEEVENEDEEPEEDETEAVEEPPKKQNRVPKSRLDEVISQREEAKERNLWLEAQLEKLIAASEKKESTNKPEVILPQYDFDGAEENYINLVIEGDIKAALKLRNEINNARKAETLALIDSIEEKANKKASSISSQAIDDQKFEVLIENFESKYPFLNADSDSYNEEAIDTVNTLLAGFRAAGKTKSEALSLAVKKVAPLYEKAIKQIVPEKKTLGQKRATTANKTAVKAAKSQPTKVKSTVSNSQVDLGTISISKLSEKEFYKLTEKEKKLLRGD